MMTPGEWISSATLAVLLVTQVWDRNKARFKALEDSLTKRIEEGLAAITKRQDRQEQETDELRTVTSDLKTDVEVIKKTCKIMHRIPDSTDPTEAPHVSQLKRRSA